MPHSFSVFAPDVPVRHLTAQDYRVMPWRNGGGSTTELTIAPEGSGLGEERFLYRVSIADVASDGPFSRFEGFDRHIMLLAGAGMTIDCGARGVLDLTTPLEPHSFSGDWDVAGHLTSGPVRDFNVIVDRARASSSLEVRELETAEVLACAAGEICIVHVVEGELGAAAAGETLVVSRPFPLAPCGMTRLAIARIMPL